MSALKLNWSEDSRVSKPIEALILLQNHTFKKKNNICIFAVLKVQKNNNKNQIYNQNSTLHLTTIFIINKLI